MARPEREPLDELRPAAHLGALVSDLERRRGAEPQSQHADLAREGEDGHRQRDDREQGEGQAEGQPPVGREAVGERGQRPERDGERHVAADRERTDPRAAAEAGAGRTGLAAQDGADQGQREEAHQRRGEIGGGVAAGGDADRERRLGEHDEGPGDLAGAGRGEAEGRERRDGGAPIDELGPGRGEQDPGHQNLRRRP